MMALVEFAAILLFSLLYSLTLALWIFSGRRNGVGILRV